MPPRILKHASRLVAAASLAGILTGPGAARAEVPASPCSEDVMIVFDASGSMGGNLEQGIATLKPRIDEVRAALAEILPAVSRVRRMGLITYGPGLGHQCNVKLDLTPTPNASELILRKLEGISPAGKTPLTRAVAQAAEVLRLSPASRRYRRPDRWRRDLRRFALRTRQGTQRRRGATDRPRHRFPLEGFLLDRRAQHPGCQVPG